MTLRAEKGKFYLYENNYHSQCLDLVHWGINLPSSVGIKNISKQERNMIKLPIVQYSVLIGIMLSDGYLGFNNRSKNVHLHFMQSLKNSNYLWFVFYLLAHYCSSSPYYYTRTRDGVFSYGVGFFTRALPCLTEIYHLFYENNKKIVPHNIFELLSPIALAHMIMGDGSSREYGLEICTDSYSLQDTLKLLNVLIIRYQLNCTLHKKRAGQYRLYISSKSMPLLRSIVSPYMHSSMLYKIGL